jgi:transposase
LIESVATDLGDPFPVSIRKFIPEADKKVVFDRHHLMTHRGKAVDEVRKSEPRQLRRAENGRLKRTRYLRRSSKAIRPREERELLRGSRRMNLRTARAQAGQENFRELRSSSIVAA